MAKLGLNTSGVSMLDVVDVMKYVKEHYNATVEITIDTPSDGAANGLLYVTAIANCGHAGHSNVAIGWSRPATPYVLLCLSKVLLEAMYEVQESLEGCCPQCARDWGLMN